MKNFQNFIENLSKIVTIEEAKKKLFEVSSNFNREKIEKGVEFAIKAHSGQYRKSGEEYVIHPILVASITSFFSDNEDMIIAALLHDVVEDTEYEFRDILLKFGVNVAHLVEGLTKITTIRDNSLIPSNIIDEKQAKQLSKKIKKGKFNFNDFLAQLESMKKLGSMKSLMGMIPGMSGMANQLKNADLENSDEIKNIKNKNIGKIEKELLDIVSPYLDDETEFLSSTILENLKNAKIIEISKGKIYRINEYDGAEYIDYCNDFVVAE